MKDGIQIETSRALEYQPLRREHVAQACETPHGYTNVEVRDRGGRGTPGGGRIFISALGQGGEANVSARITGIRNDGNGGSTGGTLQVRDPATQQWRTPNAA